MAVFVFRRTDSGTPLVFDKQPFENSFRVSAAVPAFAFRCRHRKAAMGISRRSISVTLRAGGARAPSAAMRTSFLLKGAACAKLAPQTPESFVPSPFGQYREWGRRPAHLQADETWPQLWHSPPRCHLPETS